jgi:AAA+ superfamily predicted ATPase
LAELGRIFHLSGFELGAVVVCLAPELRRKYDRLYAYLQDDITRQRPSVDLVLELLCSSESERWTARGAFAEGATLLRSGILSTVDDPQSPSGSSGLARFLAVDPRIVRFLLGEDGLDGRLAGCARLFPVTGAGPPLPDPELVERVARLAEYRVRDAGPLVFHLRGPAGTGKLAVARCASRLIGMPLISVDAGRLAGDLLPVALRDGLLHGAAVYVGGVDAVRPESVLAAVAEFGRLVFLGGEAEWTAGGVVPIEVPVPDVARAAGIWRDSLAAVTRDGGAWAEELAGRYRLPAERIPAVVRLADDNRVMTAGPLTLDGVAAACRQLASGTLGGSAVRVATTAGWPDLVLPADRADQLREIGDQFRHRHQVLGGWGFGAKLSRGKGLSALFSGPPGTGKTMAAEVLAGELGLDLYQVDLSGVVSKYVGETEKNLARIFDEAGSGNAILFFDEADALFGKRTEVADAHDRYANVETSYLLQRMDDYDGVVILASNLRQNLDHAFVRRLRFIVEFPFPEADSRRRIWATTFPADTPLAADVDFAELAELFALSGGNIRNIVLNAAFLAAADKDTLGRRHILAGTRREFEKMGKVWSEPTANED